jgi:methylphosphotriester-DNA--protein-cysteine methyltransferase
VDTSGLAHLVENKQRECDRVPPHHKIMAKAKKALRRETTIEERVQVIERRAQNQSFRKIAQDLQISKSCDQKIAAT